MYLKNSLLHCSHIKIVQLEKNSQLECFMLKNFMLKNSMLKSWLIYFNYTSIYTTVKYFICSIFILVSEKNFLKRIHLNYGIHTWTYIHNIHTYAYEIHTYNARNKDRKLVGRFFKDRMFYRLRLIHCCFIENVWEIWLIKIDFGRPNAEIGRKMANGRFISSTAHIHNKHTQMNR